MRWSPKPLLPDDARDTLPLQHRERVLAAAQLADGSWAAATPTALLMHGRRLEWRFTTYAAWDDESTTLRVDELDEADGSPRLHELVLDEPGRLPEVVYERVTASIVASRHVRVQGRAGVRVVARRMPGEQELLWQVVLDRGLDPADPEVRAVGDAAVAELRRELGG